MYPERIKKWFPGQTLTAERLNSSVNALNWLLGMAADNDADQPNDGETAISVVPPGGDVPPTPNYQNPDADNITAFGQPFNFNGTVSIMPPGAAGATAHFDPTNDGAIYYSVVTTTPTGAIQSVTTTTSAPTPQPWDGTSGGTFVACTGVLRRDTYGDYYSVDANTVFLPVIPVSSTSACGSVEDAATGQPVTAVSMLGGMTGNSVPVKSLVAGDGVNIEPRGIAGATSDAAAAAGYIRVSLSALNYDPTTALPPSDPSYSTHKPPLGGIRGISYASTADITAGTKYPRVEDGQIILFPNNVAYDSHYFALIPKNGYYMLTILGGTVDPSTSTPIFATN